MNLQILPSRDELARVAAKYFVARSVDTVARNGRFTVALSGGSTPKTLYELLADADGPFREHIPWERVQFFWSDERHVPPDHTESNYRMAYEAMLSHVPVLEGNVHRVMSERPSAQEAADEYEERIVAVTQSLDLILLGLGGDGHTASIFPASEVLNETKRLVAAPWVEKLKSYRITMTLPLLNNAAAVLFLVSGSEKAEIVKEVLEGPEQYPAQAVKPTSGELIWMLDTDAAGKLKSQ